MLSNNINYTITVSFYTVLILLFIFYKNISSAYNKNYYNILSQVNSLIIINSLNLSMPIILIVLGYIYGIQILYCIIIPDILGHLFIANVLIPYFNKRNIQYNNTFNIYVNKIYNFVFCVYRLLIILNYIYVYKILFYTFNNVENQIINFIILLFVLYLKTFLPNKYYSVINITYYLMLFSLITISYHIYIVNFNDISVFQYKNLFFQNHKNVLSNITFITLFFRFILVNFSKRLHNMVKYTHPNDINLLKDNYNLEIIKTLCIYLIALFFGLILYYINNYIPPLKIIKYIVDNYTHQLIGFVFFTIFSVCFFVSYIDVIENFIFNIKMIGNNFYTAFFLFIVICFVSIFNSETNIFVRNYTSGLFCYYLFLPVLIDRIKCNTKVTKISLHFFISTITLIILSIWLNYKYVPLIISCLSLLVYYLL